MQVKTYINVLLWLSLIPYAKHEKNQLCRLPEDRLVKEYYQSGDVIIGGVLQLTKTRTNTEGPFSLRPLKSTCDFASLQHLQHLLVFIFAVEEINSRVDILPNVTLGYITFDSCAIEWKALESTLSIISGTETIIPNYSCYDKSRLLGFVGHRLSSSSISMASVTGLYRFPQISFGTKNVHFNNKKKFPSLYHMFPDGRSQYLAVVQLLKHFGWTWVGVLSLDDESSQQSSIELQQIMTQNGICTEFMFTIYTNFLKWDVKLIDVLARSRCQVVIFNGNLDDPHVLWGISRKINLRKVFIFPFNFPYDFEELLFPAWNGSLILHLHKVEIPDLKDFLLSASPQKYPDFSILEDLWVYTLDCWENTCNRSDLRGLEQFHYDVENFRETFQVYAAVYGMAHALHEMYSHKKEESTTKSQSSWQAWKLNYYLKHVYFHTLGGEEVSFYEDRNIPIKFNILNFVMWPNSTKQTKTVGYYYQNASNYQIYINYNAIQWNPVFSQTPSSVCSSSCHLGYHKISMEGLNKCCYGCKPCPEGEITNRTDMERCFKCPEDQWTNERRDQCILKNTEFLSYHDTLGFCFVAVALLFCLLTTAALGLFYKNKDTAIVKANNQNLSFILLLSLKLSFLCPLLFIGRPSRISCLLRQVAFGIVFTISVSSVLAKTVTVVLAFGATKPNWKLMCLLGRRFSTLLLIVCSSGEVLICTIWLTICPPVPEYNTQVDVGKIILQCNEGSNAAFYIVIGYMGCLALFSFIVAFLTRKLPDTFNEAQYITFSMLVFCSVWISFLPTYLSTKGKYMVAVEVFAILSSSAGLLGCIFIPKCYIILMRPELNTRAKIVTERKSKQYTK